MIAGLSMFTPHAARRDDDNNRLHNFQRDRNILRSRETVLMSLSTRQPDSRTHITPLLMFKKKDHTVWINRAGFNSTPGLILFLNTLEDMLVDNLPGVKVRTADDEHLREMGGYREGADSITRIYDGGEDYE